MEQQVGIRDIANEFGISKQTAYTWTAKPEFPEPSAIVNGTTRIWWRTDVLAWAASIGRTPKVPLPERVEVGS